VPLWPTATVFAKFLLVHEKPFGDSLPAAYTTSARPG
jgi:hypothetical protein